MIYHFTDPSGLSGEVGFTLIDPSTIQIRARNTSTGIDSGATSADQLLTSVAFDLGLPGSVLGDPEITGGSVAIGATSVSVNFDNVAMQLVPGDDVSGEFGFGNGGATGLYKNYISGNTAGVTPFGGPNLDATAGLNGPQAGLVASTPVITLGGLGAIQNEWVALLTLSSPISDLGFLANGVRIEFGSDYAFIEGSLIVPPSLPEPGSIVLLMSGVAGFGLFRRNRSNSRT